jgi:hypothetical protein
MAMSSWSAYERHASPPTFSSQIQRIKAATTSSGISRRLRFHSKQLQIKLVGLTRVIYIASEDSAQLSRFGT